MWLPCLILFAMLISVHANWTRITLSVSHMSFNSFYVQMINLATT